MTRESEDPDADVTAPLRVPRWYNPTIIALGLAGLGTYFATQGQFNGVIVLAIIASLALFLFLLWVQRKLNTGDSSTDRRATYGSSTIFGAIWVALGIFQAALLDQYVLGGFMILFGVITVAAFGPPLLRERATRKAARQEPVDIPPQHPGLPDETTRD